MEGKYGIEILKKDFTVIAKVSGTVDLALADGEVDLMEGINIAKDSLGFFGVIRNIKEAKNEVKDLTKNERNAIVEHFKAEFDLQNDVAEMVVESVVEIVLGFIKLQEATIQAA